MARTRKESERSGSSRPEEDARLLEVVEAAVLDRLDGGQVLDHELVVDDDLHIELAAVDRAGRLVLVLLADGKILQRAIDVLGFVRRHGEVLARHIGAPAQASNQPRLLVLFAAEEPQLQRCLEPLDELGVELLQVTALRSRRHQGAYLLALDERGGAAPTAGTRPGFLETLELADRELADLLLRRMTRLDPELEVQAGVQSIVWRFHGRDLVRLDRRGGRLEASIAPGFQPQTCQGPLDVERLTDLALEALLDQGPGPAREGFEGELDLPAAPAPLPSRGMQAGTGGDAPGLAGEPDAASEDSQGGLPAHFLTAEEIQAFHE